MLKSALIVAIAIGFSPVAFAVTPMPSDWDALSQQSKALLNSAQSVAAKKTSEIKAKIAPHGYIQAPSTADLENSVKENLENVGNFVLEKFPSTSRFKREASSR